MLPERGDQFDITPLPITPFNKKRTEQLDPEAPRRLIRPTKRVVEAAMKLIKRCEVDEEHGQTAIVFDPKLRKKYRLSDYDIRDHKQESDQPHDYPGLNSGLLISTLTITGEETDELNLPRLPERVTRETLYPIQDIRPSAMRKLAKSLERAVLFNPPPVPFFS